jgi:hypothetical protein
MVIYWLRMRSTALVWSGGERPGARVPARVTAPADLQLPARATRPSLHVDSERTAGTQKSGVWSRLL